ncbi:hypothetical protein ACULTK_002858 [Yersinia enterocolitica]
MMGDNGIKSDESSALATFMVTDKDFKKLNNTSLSRLYKLLYGQLKYGKTGDAGAGRGKGSCLTYFSDINHVKDLYFVFYRCRYNGGMAEQRYYQACSLGNYFHLYSTLYRRPAAAHDAYINKLSKKIKRQCQYWKLDSVGENSVLPISDVVSIFPTKENLDARLFNWNTDSTELIPFDIFFSLYDVIDEDIKKRFSSDDYQRNKRGNTLRYLDRYLAEMRSDSKGFAYSGGFVDYSKNKEKQYLEKKMAFDLFYVCRLHSLVFECKDITSPVDFYIKKVFSPLSSKDNKEREDVSHRQVTGFTRVNNYHKKVFHLILFNMCYSIAKAEAKKNKKAVTLDDLKATFDTHLTTLDKNVTRRHKLKEQLFAHGAILGKEFFIIEELYMLCDPDLNKESSEVASELPRGASHD